MPFIGHQSSANSKVVKYTYTATANQQDFTTIVDSGDTISVYLNGVLLKETTDYTYTSTTVSLVAGASVGDIVEVHVFVSMVLADAVRASGDTMTGDLETTALKTNTIKGADNSNKITFDASPDTTLVGDLIVGGNVIQASDGGNTITLDTSDNVTIAGDLKVGAVKASDGTAGISIADSTGRITVTENNPVITLGSNTTFPTKVTDRTVFYIAQKTGNHFTSYDDYLITQNFVGGEIRMSGVAPTGFTDIVSAEIVTLDGQSGSSNLLNLRWMIGGNGQQYHTHSLSSTNIFNGTYAANAIRYTSFLGVGSSGSRFEQLITEGDAFGLRVISSGSQNVYGIGAKITWRF